MAHSLVQQDPGPAGAEHDFHGPRRRLHSIQIHEGLAHRLAREIRRTLRFKKIFVAETPAAACKTLFAPPLLLDDHADVEANQGPNVSRKRPVGRRHQHYVMQSRQTDHDLLYTRIRLARCGIDASQQRDFVACAEALHGIHGEIELVSRPSPPGLNASLTAAAGNGTCGTRGMCQRRHHDLVGIGETGLLPAHRTDAHTLIDPVATVLDDAVLEGPGFVATDLEIEVRAIDSMAHEMVKERLQVPIAHPYGLQDPFPGAVDIRRHGRLQGSFL